MRPVKIVALALFAAILHAPLAFAGPITGGLSMAGFNQHRITSGAPPVVVGLDFSKSPTFIVGSLDGDFTVLNNLSGAISNFTFASLPATPLWTVGSISFYALSTEDLDAHVSLGNPLFFNIKGYVRATGFDDTPAIWSYTGNDRGRTGSWSASLEIADALQVPEPATLALMGVGLLALSRLRRRH